MSPSSSDVFEDLGIREPDVELAKADLAIQIHRLAGQRRLTLDEAATLLKVPKSELPTLSRTTRNMLARPTAADAYVA
jgi:predicted XRE-type DNA-binding protein